MNRRLAVDVAACVLLLVQFLLGMAQATGTMSGPAGARAGPACGGRRD
jgi:hypothetical protein